MLLQKLSVLSAGWDDELDEALTNESKEILKEMIPEKDIVFPRSIKPAGTVGQLELVGFWDGGDPASARCLYA